MKLTSIVIGLLLFVTARGELSTEVSVIQSVGHVEVRDGKKISETRKTTVVVYVSNAGGSTVRVPTRNFEVSHKLDNGTGVATIYWTYAGADSPRSIVIPEQDFGFVELRSSETAVIYIEWPKDWPNPDTLQFELSASKQLRERYNFSLPTKRAVPK